MHEAFDIIDDTARKFAVSQSIWAKNDEIFNFVEIEAFKNIFASKYRSLKIILVCALEKIDRRMREKRTELLEKYHIDTLTQNHFTPTKTSNEIMKKYHWSGIHRDAIRFAKNCTDCKRQRGELTIAQTNLDS